VCGIGILEIFLDEAAVFKVDPVVRGRLFLSGDVTPDVRYTLRQCRLVIRI
jgi:hypothetical protein